MKKDKDAKATEVAAPKEMAYRPKTAPANPTEPKKEESKAEVKPKEEKPAKQSVEKAPVE